MGSFFGEQNMNMNMNMMGRSDNERSNSGDGSNSNKSSPKKGKSKSNSGENKPKKPQRGLGVAQLEKIRLHGMGFPHMQEEMRMQATYTGGLPSFGYHPSSTSSAPYGFHPNMMMGYNEMERANIRFADSQHRTDPRWSPGNNVFGGINSEPPQNITRQLLKDLQEKEDDMQNRRNRMGYCSSQNSGTSEDGEIDLELRL